MNYVGVSCGFHDAAVSVVGSDGSILYAGHSERYSKIKHDKHLCDHIIKDAISYTNSFYEVHYYEKPLLKFFRELRAGQSTTLPFVKNIIGNENVKLLNTKKIYTHGHHLSHAAAGFQTSPFADATVVIIDAIGEFDTITIWNAHYDSTGIARYKQI